MEPKYIDYDYEELEQWVRNDESLWLWFTDRFELDPDADDEVQMCQFIHDERDSIILAIEEACGVHP